MTTTGGYQSPRIDINTTPRECYPLLFRCTFSLSLRSIDLCEIQVRGEVVAKLLNASSNCVILQERESRTDNGNVRISDTISDCIIIQENVEKLARK